MTVAKAKSALQSSKSGDPKGEQSPKPQNDPSKLRKQSSGWTGFTKTSNLLLFLLTAGVFAVFSAFHLKFLEKSGHWIRPPSPGESYWFSDGLMRLGMQVHLWSVVPAGILLPLQFLPVLRRRYLYAHKLAGRTLFVFLIVGNITALTIARHSFGGRVSTQAAVVTLVTITTIGIYKSWTSIRNLEIDRHRAWTIRTWSWACSILSLRIFVGILLIIIQRFSPNGFKFALTCVEVEYINRSTFSPDLHHQTLVSLYDRYPACATSTVVGVDTYVVVNASLDPRYPEEKAALMNTVFGAAAFLGVIVHVLLVEVYLDYTKDEGERLMRISLARRRATGARE